MNRTAVVILNWNTKEYLEKFLPGVISSCEGLADVVVADSASTDGSLEAVARLFPQIRTIPLDKNYGFTGGYNGALEVIRGDGYEYYVIMNSDIEVSDSWLGPLVGWMDSHPDCGACAPKLHSWYQKDMFEYAGASGGLIDKFGYTFCRGRILKRVEKDEGQYDKPADVFWVSGACLMTRAELFHKEGGFDGRFFAHMEEIDLCWRMQLDGWKITVVPESTVWHIGGGTLPQSSPWKLFLNYRNNLLMLENNLAKTYSLRMDADKATVKAKRLITKRMALDGLSAIVYLITLKPKNFKAVLNAHKDYRRLSSPASKEEIESYMESHRGKAEVRGVYGKWIVLESLVKRGKVFDITH